MLFNHPEPFAEGQSSIQQDRRIFRLRRVWHCECNRVIKAIEELSQFSTPLEGTMRSELVFGATTYVSNRFLLTRVAATATRRFHRQNARIQDTVNEVFERFARANPLAGVPYASNLQSFPCAAQGEPHPFYEDLEQSVA
jgi:hypothetical protein